MEVILGIPFLFLSNANVKFIEQSGKLTWRSYNIVKALPIITSVESINNKEFAKATLEENSKSFMMHIAALETMSMSIYPS